MNTIYKYPLQVTDDQTVKLPKYSNILCVQMQNEMPCLWAEVDSEEKETEDVQVKIVGTGNPFNRESKPEAHHEYLGTVQMRGGSLVWHVYVLRSNTSTID